MLSVMIASHPQMLSDLVLSGGVANEALNAQLECQTK